MERKPPGFKPTEQENVVSVSSSAPSRDGNSTKGRKVKLEKKFPKLFGLRCWGMAQEKIKAGVALEEVARWIQEDMLEYQDSKRESLTRMLYRFKSELPEDEIVREKPTYVDEAVEKMRRGINELDELEKLYLLQLKRISLDAQTEDRIKKLFKTTNKEIELAQTLLVKRMEMKAKLGLVDTVPTEFNVNQKTMNMNANMNVNMGATLGGTDLTAGMDDERRIRLGVIAEKLVTTLTKASDTDIKAVIEPPQ